MLRKYLYMHNQHSKEIQCYSIYNDNTEVASN